MEFGGTRRQDEIDEKEKWFRSKSGDFLRFVAQHQFHILAILEERVEDTFQLPNYVYVDIYVEKIDRPQSGDAVCPKRPALIGRRFIY